MAAVTFLHQILKSYAQFCPGCITIPTAQNVREAKAIFASWAASNEVEIARVALEKRMNIPPPPTKKKERKRKEREGIKLGW